MFPDDCYKQPNAQSYSGEITDKADGRNTEERRGHLGGAKNRTCHQKSGTDNANDELIDHVIHRL